MSNIFLQAIMHQACQLPTDPSQLAFTICREILVFVLNYKHFLTKPTAAEIVSVFDLEIAHSYECAPESSHSSF